MKKIFAMYKLKSGISLKEYSEWSINTDQKITSAQPGVLRFEVYSIKRKEGEDFPDQIMEVIEVDSIEQWGKVTSSKAMSKVMETFKNYADESTVKLLYGEKIE